MIESRTRPVRCLRVHAIVPSARRRSAVGLALSLLVLVSLSCGAPRAAIAAERRPVPDYDGRGGKPTTPGDVLIWVPRVALFPLYLTSEYLLRRPLGWLITNAERARVPATLYNFFTFGPDHQAGFIPTAFVDFGFRPSFGIYVFWDDAGFRGHDLRLHLATGGANWFAGSFTERFRLSEHRHLTLNASASRRPDYAFYGVGPQTLKSDIARYGADTVDAGAVADFRLWRSSRVETSLGFRSVSFFPGYYLGQPNIDALTQAGRFPVPDGYPSGYQAGLSQLSLALDTREPESGSRSGGRLGLEGEQGVDFRRSVPSGWLRYGAELGGFLDLGQRARVVSLSVATRFAQPLGSRPVPFTELVTLGGVELMPGFRAGRLRDRSAAVATLRYSWPIWVWLNGSLQGAVGNVFGAQLAGFQASLLRYSAAVGVESHGSPDSTFQLLFGVGSQTFAQGGAIDSIRISAGARSGF